MNRKAFARTKEELAASVPHVVDAAAGAQVAEVYQLPKKRGGQDLDARQALEKVTQVSLGKCSVIYRLGNSARERASAIEELSAMIRRERTKSNRPRVPFDYRICRCIAATALDELAVDMCFSCKGSGVVRDHDIEKLEGRQPMKVCPGCKGTKRHQYKEDERVKMLSEEWARQNGGEPTDAPTIAKQLRKERRLPEMLSAINFARGLLLEAERVAIEETARMCERWFQE